MHFQNKKFCTGNNTEKLRTQISLTSFMYVRLYIYIYIYRKKDRYIQLITIP